MRALGLGHQRLSGEPDALVAEGRRCGRLPLSIRLAGARFRARTQWTLASPLKR